VVTPSELSNETTMDNIAYGAPKSDKGWAQKRKVTGFRPKFQQ